MNWEAIGAIGEFFGASAVFISLLYLGIQIRNSRRSDQIIASASLSGFIDDWVREIVQDAELCELYRNGLRDYNSLSQAEKVRFSLLIFQFLRRSEAGWIQSRTGIIDRSYWLGVENSIGIIIRTAGGLRSFQKYRQSLGPEFAVEIERILASEESTDS